jgi:carbon storage regulator
MLVLSRHVCEKIMIGDDIVIEVISIRGDKVRLGFTAPIEIPVDREEIRDAKLRDGSLR